MSKTQVAAKIIRVSHLAPLFRRLGQPGVLGLAYHRVCAGLPPLFDRGLWSATPDGFDRQVALLKRECDIISPSDLDDVRRLNRGRYVLISFDDGYRDNFDVAFPILKSHGVPATFFVATGFIDRPRVPWWDEIAWMVRSSPRDGVPESRWLPTSIGFDEPLRERAVQALLARYKSLPGQQADSFLSFLADATGTGRCMFPEQQAIWMSWDMLRQMHRAGMTVGAHTVNHPILARLSPRQQKEEIFGSCRRISEELGTAVTCFAYPRGKPDAFNDDTRRCLQEAGVQHAFSYYGGYRRFRQWDPYDIRRCYVELDTTLAQFEAVLTFPQFFG